MNKKFSTLAVAAMLASAFTVNAAPGDVVTKLAEGNNGKAYQLVTKDTDGKIQYLSLNANDGLKLVSNFNRTSSDGNSYNLGGSLWCVNVTLENQGKTIIYDFTNKAHGDILDVTVGGYTTATSNGSADGWRKLPNGVVVKTLERVGGEVAGWAFAPVLGADAKKNVDNPNYMFNSKSVDKAKRYALRSYITSNKVATLVWGEGNSIQVAVVNADELEKVKPENEGFAQIDREIQFCLKEASAVNLTAAEFNSVLFTQKEDFQKLTFEKDYNNTDIVNPFSTNDLQAEAISGDTEGFVRLYKKNADGTKAYLRVDTAYANGYGTKFLTFAFGSEFGANKSNKPDEETYGFMKDQYKFRLNYCLTEDSLSIQAKSAVYKVNDLANSPEASKWWRNYAAVYDVATQPTEYSNNEFYLRTYKTQLNVDGSYVDETEAKANTNYVKLQDLEAATESRIVTVGQLPINTHVSFGFGHCTAVQAEYTSVADGVYYIKNAKGQYLAHPIYSNGSGAPSFVTVNADEQDVAHMPAYQWVVLKEYTETAGTKKFSPVKIANREYDTNFSKYNSIQLKQAEGAAYMYVSGNTIQSPYDNSYIKNSFAVDSLLFEAVPQSSIEDPYLGYKKLTKDELTTGGKYTFNYWHPYAQDKYIAQAEKDSTFAVWNEISAFNIDTVYYNPEVHKGNIWTEYYDDNYQAVAERLVSVNKVDVPTVDIDYGFDPENVKDSKGNLRIKGLAQLVRTVYKVKLNGSDLKVNENDQFNTGKNSWAYNNADENSGVQKFDEYLVLFKENMHVNGQHYYAILQAQNYQTYAPQKQYDETGKELKYKKHEDVYYPVTDDKGTVLYYMNYPYVSGSYKAGVSDYDGAATLKNQPLSETRTSSFAINRDETPLYRRFNSAALEGQAGDAADTLRFYEKYRNEYLMIEANPSFMVEHIDFLGINAQDKAQGGLAFIVDTAWVNRGAGNIKPQYLISIDRHDFAGTPGVPCTYEHNHYDNQGNAVDAAHCSHAIPATPGFARGKFLINFHDFANNDKMVGSDDYKWAEYDRAGFKEAIVVGDTLYILRDEFKNLPNEEIDLAKLASAEVEALRAWTNAGKDDQNARNFLSYRYELTGDNHKYVTWSMRFYNPSVAANEVESDRAFLIESMKSLSNNKNSKDANNANYAHGEKDVHNGVYGINSAEGNIAPTYAAWLKMQNGCLVLSNENSKFEDVTTGVDDALIFNVEHVCGDKVAVDNENIAVEGVSVVAGNGQVTIMGAAGKNVTITNILGKVIASQVIASDNATIAVPAGIVAVAVEGEAAVKAIVK